MYENIYIQYNIKVSENIIIKVIGNHRGDLIINLRLYYDMQYIAMKYQCLNFNLQYNTIVIPEEIEMDSA